MPAPTSYTFYGFVENGFVDDQLIVDPAAFGYVPGQRVGGSLSLYGSVAQSWTNQPATSRVLSFATELARVETDFVFAPAAPGGEWTEADFSSSPLLGSTRDTRPLEEVRATLFHSDQPDGPTLRFDQHVVGGAMLTNDDGRAALISGAWVPSNITPNLFYGTAGDDVLRAHGPLSMVWGGAGDDAIRVMSGEGFVWGGAGDDTISGGGRRDFIWGGNGDDFVFGSAGDDVLNGQHGDDTIEGGSGADRIMGGWGDDLIKGGSGNDLLDGGGGLDRIYGGAGNDVLYSGTGRFDENFELERSISDGGSGNDTILASFDAILTGGSGADIFQVGRVLGFEGRLSGIDITDFRAGIDRIAIIAGEPGDYDSFEEIMAAADQVGSDVVFEFFGSEVADLPSLVLQNVRLSALSGVDFIFGDI